MHSLVKVQSSVLSVPTYLVVPARQMLSPDQEFAFDPLLN